MVERFCKNNLVVVLYRLFFNLGDRIKVAGRVRQVVVLYSNDCKGIYLDGHSIVRI